jgi:hypothetical protein
MHQNSVALDTPAKKGRGGFKLKKRSAYVGALAALVGGMAFADVASAHYLPRDLAEQSAKAFAQSVVNDPRTPYIFGTAVCDPDSQAVPHLRGCTLMYDTPASRPTTQWACTERVQIVYKPHNAGDPPPNFTRFIRRGFTHPC